MELPGWTLRCGRVQLGSAEFPVEMAVLRAFSPARARDSTPVLYVTGGPGLAQLENLPAERESWEPFLALRDLIFFDAPGTGLSSPSLECQQESLADCYEGLRPQLASGQWGSVALARQLDELRHALGYEVWDVWGSSYGTRVALTLLRDFPHGVRASILDAVVPLEVDWFAEKGSRAAEALQRAGEEECERVMQRSPFCPWDVTHLVTLAQELDEREARGKQSLRGEEALRLIFRLLRTRVGRTQLFPFLRQLQAGHISFPERAEETRVALGVYYATQCAEESPFTTQEAIAQADAALPPELREALSGAREWRACEEFPVPPAPLEENLPVHSRHPSLILAGALDPITPPSYGRLVQEQLPRSSFVIVPGDAHGSAHQGCGRELVKRFLQRPEPSPELVCSSP